jgi:hypothetical protein
MIPEPGTSVILGALDSGSGPTPINGGVDWMITDESGVNGVPTTGAFEDQPVRDRVAPNRHCGFERLLVLRHIGKRLSSHDGIGDFARDAIPIHSYP